MASRIDVQYTTPDARGKVKLGYFNSLGLSKPVQSVSIVDSYTIDVPLKHDQLQKVAHALVNPVMQAASVSAPLFPEKFDWAIEVGFLPGVTDNVGTTARETV